MREQHETGHPIPNNPENIHASNRLNRFYLCVYVCVYVCVCMYVCMHILHITTINEKRSYEFEKAQGGAYGQVPREKSKRGDCIIINLKK